MTDGTTHDYETVTRAPAELDSTCVLVGECGGLSAVFDVRGEHMVPGLVAVETEHGMLLLDPDGTCEVLVG